MDMMEVAREATREVNVRKDEAKEDARPMMKRLGKTS